MILRFWLVFGLTCGIAAADSANDYFGKALRNAIPNPFINKQQLPRLEIPNFSQDYQWRSKLAQVDSIDKVCAIRLAEVPRPNDRIYTMRLLPPTQVQDAITVPGTLQICEK